MVITDPDVTAPKSGQPLTNNAVTKSLSKIASQKACNYSILRLAIRMVHCLQKERGASCAAYTASSSLWRNQKRTWLTSPIVKSGGMEDLGNNRLHDLCQVTLQSMTEARANTDCALRIFNKATTLRRTKTVAARSNKSSSVAHDLPIKDTLARVRTLIDGTMKDHHGVEGGNPIHRPPPCGGHSSSSPKGSLSKANDGNNDNAEKCDDASKSLGFHRILVMLNALLSNIIHVYIIQVVQHEKQRLKSLGSEFRAGKNFGGSGRIKSLGSSNDSSPQHRRNTSLDGGATCRSNPGPDQRGGLEAALKNPRRPSPSTSDLRGNSGEGLRGLRDRIERAASIDPPSSNSFFRMGSYGTPPQGYSPPAFCNSFTGVYAPPPNTLISVQYDCSDGDAKASIPDGIEGQFQKHEVGKLGSARREPPEASEATQSGGKALSLLSLLVSFVRLKESTGIERAVLSSLMAMGTKPPDGEGSGDECNYSSDEDNKEEGQDTPLPLQRTAAKKTEVAGRQLSMLFTDLVFEVENQRNIIRDLRAKTRLRHRVSLTTTKVASLGGHGGRNRGTTAPPMDDDYRSLLALVEQSIELSPQMAHLQNMIRLKFDITGFQQAMKMEEFWALITLYIDKLHSLELLIIEELECCLAKEVRPLTPEAGRLTNGILAFKGPGKDDSRLKGKNGAESPEKVDSTIMGSTENPVEPLEVGHLPFLSSFLDSTSGTLTRQQTAEIIKNTSPEKLKGSILSYLNNLGASRTSSAGSTPPSEEDKGDKKVIDNPILNPDMNVPENSKSLAATKEWEINLYEIQFKKRVGRGSAGTTYLAKWCGQDVAVKVAAITELGLEGWNTEVRSLQRLHHPNIIRLLGSIYNPSPLTYCLVLEYCDAGDLSSALQRRAPPNFFSVISENIANGMAYLHSRNILHRDIKPANILLHGNVAHGNFTAKVTDFGVATMIQVESEEERTAETGTYRWMAPEVIRHETYSRMADVYSFSLLTWQLLTREDPFCDLSQIEAAGTVAIEHTRPPFPGGVPAAVKTLIEICWSEDPNKRMPFDDVCAYLKQLNKSFTQPEKEWLESPFGHPVYKVSEDEEEQDLEYSVSPAEAAQLAHNARGSRTGSLVGRSKSWHSSLEEKKHKNTDRKSLRNMFSMKKKK